MTTWISTMGTAIHEMARPTVPLNASILRASAVSNRTQGLQCGHPEKTGRTMADWPLHV
jgi:hypothetical protein